MTQLSPCKSATKRIRKQMKKRIEAALEILGKQRVSVTDVHEARKSLKKARASLRLLRPALRTSDFSQENAQLRDAARPLGVARDAQVLPETLRLVARYAGTPTSALHVKLKPDTAHIAPRDLAHSRQLLREARSRLRDLDFETDNWDAIGPALRQVYKQGRRALADARTQTTAEAFHEWRKQAKYLRYALETLEPLWPPLIQRMADEAHELTNCLGNDHDLNVLRQETGNAQPLAKLITQLQQELRHEALALGAKLYDAKPGVFTHRFADYWKEWRHSRPA